MSQSCPLSVTEFSDKQLEGEMVCSVSEFRGHHGGEVKTAGVSNDWSHAIQGRKAESGMCSSVLAPSLPVSLDLCFSVSLGFSLPLFLYLCLSLSLCLCLSVYLSVISVSVFLFISLLSLSL